MYSREEIIERRDSRRAIMDFEQVTPLVGVGAPPTVYCRWRYSLESEFFPGYMMVEYS